MSAVASSERTWSTRPLSRRVVSSHVMAIDLAQAFLDHTPIPGVTFEHNDYVQIVRGEHAGQRGSLVTVLTLSPEPRFILELETGHDIEVLQSEIERVLTLGRRRSLGTGSDHRVHGRSVIVACGLTYSLGPSFPA
jgi:hypothetical protein